MKPGSEVTLASRIADRIDQAATIRNHPMQMSAHTLNMDAVIHSVREAGRVQGLMQAAEMVRREFPDE